MAGSLGWLFLQGFLGWLFLSGVRAVNYGFEGASCDVEAGVCESGSEEAALLQFSQGKQKNFEVSSISISLPAHGSIDARAAIRDNTSEVDDESSDLGAAQVTESELLENVNSAMENVSSAMESAVLGTDVAGYIMKCAEGGPLVRNNYWCLSLENWEGDNPEAIWQYRGKGKGVACHVAWNWRWEWKDSTKMIENQQRLHGKWWCLEWKFDSTRVFVKGCDATKPEQKWLVLHGKHGVTMQARDVLGPSLIADLGPKSALRWHERNEPPKLCKMPQECTDKETVFDCHCARFNVKWNTDPNRA